MNNIAWADWEVRGTRSQIEMLQMTWWMTAQSFTILPIIPNQNRQFVKWLILVPKWAVFRDLGKIVEVAVMAEYMIGRAV